MNTFDILNWKTGTASFQIGTRYVQMGLCIRTMFNRKAS